MRPSGVGIRELIKGGIRGLYQRSGGIPIIRGDRGISINKMGWKEYLLNRENREVFSWYEGIKEYPLAGGMGRIPYLTGDEQISLSREK